MIQCEIVGVHCRHRISQQPSTSAQTTFVTSSGVLVSHNLSQAPIFHLVFRTMATTIRDVHQPVVKKFYFIFFEKKKINQMNILRYENDLMHISHHSIHHHRHRRHHHCHQSLAARR